ETVIFHEGDEGNGLYVLTRGAVRISKHSAGGEEALTILEPFAFFGEMALIDAAPRAADAIAHGDTELFFLPLSDLRFLFEARPSLALKILFALSATLAQRLRETNERYMSLFTLAQWGTSQNGLIPLS
ncbi:MAG: Crp/Fnr family transcriptional regulator, partial [Firmicutes bacterium]|nr:Crp/Fnr family transcriptional regulator [Bacillota bacterium]